MSCGVPCGSSIGLRGSRAGVLDQRKFQEGAIVGRPDYDGDFGKTEQQLRPRDSGRAPAHQLDDAFCSRPIKGWTMPWSLMESGEFAQCFAGNSFRGWKGQGADASQRKKRWRRSPASRRGRGGRNRCCCRGLRPGGFGRGCSTIMLPGPGPKLDLPWMASV